MAKVNTRYLEAREFDRWNKFVENQEQGSVFQHVDWLQTIFRFQDKKIETRVIVCLDKEENIVGGIAFGSMRKYGIRMVIRPYLSPFSGVLVTHKKSKYLSKDIQFRKEVLRHLIDFIEKDHKIIDLNVPPDITDIRPFSWKGYDITVRYTFRKRLEKEEGLFKNFDPALRRQIKKAEKNAIKVQHVSDDLYIEQFHKLLILSFQRQGIGFFLDSNDFLSFIHTLRANDVKIRFYLAFKSGHAIAGCAMLFTKNTVYYWMAGADPAYFSSGGNQILLWQAFQDFQNEGMELFDFMGANTPGITDYKATYNFELVPYYKVKKSIGFYAGLFMQLKRIFY